MTDDPDLAIVRQALTDAGVDARVWVGVDGNLMVLISPDCPTTVEDALEIVCQAYKRLDN